VKKTVLIVILVLLAAGCGKKGREQYPVVPNQVQQPQLQVTASQVSQMEGGITAVTTEEGMRVILLDKPNPSDEMMAQAARGIQSRMAEELNIGMCVSPQPLTVQTPAGPRSGYGIGPCDIFGSRTVGQAAHGEGDRTKGR